MRVFSQGWRRLFCLGFHKNFVSIPNAKRMQGSRAVLHFLWAKGRFMVQIVEKHVAVGNWTRVFNCFFSSATVWSRRMLISSTWSLKWTSTFALLWGLRSTSAKGSSFPYFVMSSWYLEGKKKKTKTVIPKPPAQELLTSSELQVNYCYSQHLIS